jgi:hypothetical protein
VLYAFPSYNIFNSHWVYQDTNPILSGGVAGKGAHWDLEDQATSLSLRNRSKDDGYLT